MTERLVRGRLARVWPALMLGLAATATLTGGLLAGFAPSVSVLYGLPALGPVVDVGLPAARVVAMGAAAAAVGNLLLAAVLVPGDPDGLVSPSGYAGLRAARGWSVVQACASMAVAVFTVAENSGMSPGRFLTRPDALITGIGQIEQATGWALAALIASVVGLLAGWALSWRSALGLLLLALAGLLPVTLTAATNAERSHDIAGDALTLHVLGAVLWLGSTIAVVAHLARTGTGKDEVLRRHTAIATWSLPLVGASGVVSAAYAVAPSDLLTSGYGRLVVVSAALLLGLVAVAKRARAAVAAPSGRTSALRLAGVEVLLLAAAAAAGTGLTRLFPPAEAGYQPSRLVYLLGYDLPSHLTALDLAVRWRFDLVFGPLAVLAAALYLVGVRRLHRAGRTWPAGRTAAWLAGCTVLLVATSSGLGTYGPAVFSVHMVQHMLIATFVPVLLVLGHGVTMALELAPDRLARRLVSLLESPAVRLARNPAIAWAAVAVTLFGLYPTGLFDTIVQQHWAHLAMDAAFFLTGLALFWPVLGYSLPGRGLPAIGRIVMVFAVMALHAAFASWLLSRATPLATSFYGALRLPFVPGLLADQRRGAVLAWLLGEVPVLLAVFALVFRWTRADRSPPEPEPEVWPGLRTDADDMTYTRSVSVGGDELRRE
ncbi:MAG: copper resistance protein CopD [Pseudonocardiales bacterium]|nr:MAG: copper resistance protein CopD [Pseudonocardiales bacterium]